MLYAYAIAVGVCIVADATIGHAVDDAYYFSDADTKAEQAEQGSNDAFAQTPALPARVSETRWPHFAKSLLWHIIWHDERNQNSYVVCVAS